MGLGMRDMIGGHPDPGMMMTPGGIVMMDPHGGIMNTNKRKIFNKNLFILFFYIHVEMFCVIKNQQILPNF